MSTRSIHHYERGELTMLLDPESIRDINRWLARDDGVAVYENQDLGHYDLGHKKFVSYGSPDAFFEVEEEEDLPDRLPDTRTEINWRYWLVGTYRGGAL